MPAATSAELKKTMTVPTAERKEVGSPSTVTQAFSSRASSPISRF
jgi:hypothetical protein